MAAYSSEGLQGQTQAWTQALMDVMHHKAPSQATPQRPKRRCHRGRQENQKEPVQEHVAIGPKLSLANLDGLPQSFWPR